MSPDSPKKILVIVLDNLGDVVMGSSLFGPLRTAFPRAAIGIWVKKYAAGVFDLQGSSIRVHAADLFWDKSPGRGKGGWRPFLRTLGEIRAEGYDLAFVLNAEWRRSLACRWAGIRNRVGHGKRKAGIFLSRAVPATGGRKHVVEEHAELFAAWTGARLPLSRFKPQIGLSDGQRRRGEEWESGLRWSDKTIVVLHALTGDPGKDWPLRKWTRLVRLLSRRSDDFRFVVLSSPKEASVLNGVFEAFPKSALRVSVGSVSEIKPIVSRGDIFIGGDSGPGHLAAALGVPVVSLFGPTDPDRYRPIGDAPIKVIRRDPLSELSVDEVIETVLASKASNFLSFATP
ncbi:MAG: glycosyltransferase family 9 protein [Elusimicrobiota bacterium]